MYNKKKCKTCKYHSRLTGSVGKSDPGSIQTIMCAYCLTQHATALKYLDADASYDSRGSDPENCLLYVEGRPDRKLI